MIDDIREFRVSNDALPDAGELRRRMAADGYLFFRGLLDPDRLRELRREMLEAIAAGGWLAPGADPMAGIADPGARCTEGDLSYVDVYHQVYRLESFHRAAHWPAILDVLAKVIDGSVVGRMGNAGQANYAASKAGLEGFSRSLAREVASRGVTVNVVAPGMIDTDMTAGLDESAQAALLAQIPMGRLGTTDDVAGAVCFLASDEAAYVTGHVLAVNGGMYM